MTQNMGGGWWNYFWIVSWYKGIHYKVPDKLIPILFEPKLIAFQCASGIVSRIFI